MTHEQVMYLEVENERLQKRVKALEEVLGDAYSLLGDFAGSYLSKDGKTVIEDRGSMGRSLAELWPRIHALLPPEEP